MVIEGDGVGAGGDEDIERGDPEGVVLEEFIDGEGESPGSVALQLDGEAARVEVVGGVGFEAAGGVVVGEADEIGPDGV